MAAGSIALGLGPQTMGELGASASAGTDEAAHPPPSVCAGTGSVAAAGGARKSRPRLALRVPTRSLSYSFATNDCGLTTFSYSVWCAGQPQQRCLAERGENGFSLATLSIGPQLGHGQEGSVLLAKHEGSGMTYALKGVNIADSGTRHQVARELAVYGVCQSGPKHPNIVALFDAFYAEGRVYMVLELMTWGSLELAMTSRRDQFLRLQRRPEKTESGNVALQCQRGGRRGWAMEEPVVAGVGAKLLCALNFLHTEHRIVHRDIKPGNVMLNRDGGVKLSDFGVSVIGAADTDSIAGTTGYMSPERLEGKVCSEKGDIWALGIMLLECAKGLHPLIHANWRDKGEYDERNEAQHAIDGVQSGDDWTHWTIFDVRAKVVEDEISAKNMGFSEEMVALIELCLIKEEASRPMAETLLRMPFITMHDGQQERLMRAWLEKLGQPDGKEEAPIFMQWDCNPLLPPPTPQGARRSRSPTPSSHAVCGPERQADQVLDSRDLERCPLQFLLDSNQVRLDGDRAAAALPPQKRAKTQDSVPSGLS